MTAIYDDSGRILGYFVTPAEAPTVWPSHKPHIGLSRSWGTIRPVRQNRAEATNAL